MSGYAVVRSRYRRQTASSASTWARDYLRRAALVDLGCAVVSVLAAVQLRFGNHTTETYAALSLALPGLWLAAAGLTALCWPPRHRVVNGVAGSCAFCIGRTGDEDAQARP